MSEIKLSKKEKEVENNYLLNWEKWVNPNKYVFEEYEYPKKLTKEDKKDKIK